MTDKKVAILIEDDFEDIEALYPLYRMKEEGAQVTVVGPEKRSYSGKKGYKVAADASIDEARQDDFDLLIIPGGKAPAKIRKSEGMVDFARGFTESGRPVAAICHGPQLLVAAGVARGKNLTCYPPIKKELIGAGARFADKAVQRDGNIITSRRPADLPYFMSEILDQFP
ncbi:MAG: type 1 glutamine amidotransferase domain-containing protein [Terriglobia bacterium]